MVIRNYADVKVYIKTEDILKENVIYCLTFPNGKVYIGKTKNKLSSRLSEHCNRAFEQKSKSFNNKKERAIRKYLTFSVDILYSGDDLNDNEIKFIKEFDSFKNGYNCTIGGDGSSGANTNLGSKQSKETIEKRAAKLRGRTRNKSVVEKIAAKNSKPVLQFDLDNNFIREFKSLADIKRLLYFSNLSNISQVCKGKRNKAYKYIWKYKN